MYSPHFDNEPVPPPPEGMWTTWPRRHVLALVVLLVASNFLIQAVVFGLGGGLFWPVLSGAVLGVLAPLFWIVRVRQLDPVYDLGLDRPALRELIAAVVMALGAILPTSLLAEISLRLHPVDPDWANFLVESLPRTTPEILLATLTVVVAAPLVEELIFRGLIQRLAAVAWGTGAGIVVSALVFAIVHNEAWYLFGLIGVGLVLAYIYAVTGSVTTCWVAHGAHNAFSLWVMVTAGDELSVEPTAFTLQEGGWLLLSLLGLVAGGMYLRTRRGPR